MQLQNRPVKRNGFSTINGVNYFQIIAGIYFLLDTAFCYYMMTQFDLNKMIYLMVWESSISIIVVYSYIRATACDTTDPVIYAEQEAEKKGILYETELTSYCIVCKGHVQDRSKHCGSCNRCTLLFDHHCIWLNNCVGSQNYNFFLTLVIGLIFMKITKIIVDSISISKNGNMLWIGIVSVIIDSLFLLSIGYLLAMHIYFITMNITSYDWIKQNRELKLKQTELKQIPAQIRKQSKDQDMAELKPIGTPQQSKIPPILYRRVLDSTRVAIPQTIYHGEGNQIISPMGSRDSELDMKGIVDNFDEKARVQRFWVKIIKIQIAQIQCTCRHLEDHPVVSRTHHSEKQKNSVRSIELDESALNSNRPEIKEPIKKLNAPAVLGSILNVINVKVQDVSEESIVMSHGNLSMSARSHAAKTQRKSQQPQADSSVFQVKIEI